MTSELRPADLIDLAAPDRLRAWLDADGQNWGQHERDVSEVLNILDDIAEAESVRANQAAYAARADRIEALEAEVERLREELADAYIKLSGKSIHTSDCATSSAPAMKPGPCDCAALGEKQ